MDGKHKLMAERDLILRPALSVPAPNPDNPLEVQRPTAEADERGREVLASGVLVSECHDMAQGTRDAAIFRDRHPPIGYWIRFDLIERQVGIPCVVGPFTDNETAERILKATLARYARARAAVRQ